MQKISMSANKTFGKKVLAQKCSLFPLKQMLPDWKINWLPQASR